MRIHLYCLCLIPVNCDLWWLMTLMLHVDHMHCTCVHILVHLVWLFLSIQSSPSALGGGGGGEELGLPLEEGTVDIPRPPSHRYCRVCRHIKPLRTKHCYTCGRCVRRFDHHCPWLGNCVGERNHRFFWLFLTFETALLIWGTIISW